MFEYSDVDASTEKCEAAKTGAERYLGYVTLSDNQWFPLSGRFLFPKN